MVVFTNPGSSVPARLAEKWGIETAPQSFLFGSESFDTRTETLSLAEFDRRFAATKAFPRMMNPTIADYVDLLRAISTRDAEILAVLLSRKIANAYMEVASAARSLKADKQIQVALVDTGFSDLGTGLPCLLAAMAARQGMPMTDVAALVAQFCAGAAHTFVPDSLDWLVAAGRVSPLRAWFVKALSQRPQLAIEAGVIVPIARLDKRPEHVVAGIVEYLLTKVPRGRAVWVGIGHGAAPEKAALLETALRERYDVRYLLSRPLHASIYHSAGPRTVGCFVAPIDELPWAPDHTPDD